mmetsp:Transcript_52380/g.122892  ORF Transcript_52380/g.122892 Transcript_52380/m.122892 type:complete len:215 (+) Transcript_52380:837-1481(+)
MVHSPLCEGRAGTGRAYSCAVRGHAHSIDSPRQLASPHAAADFCFPGRRSDQRKRPLRRHTRCVHRLRLGCATRLCHCVGVHSGGHCGRGVPASRSADGHCAPEGAVRAGGSVDCRRRRASLDSQRRQERAELRRQRPSPAVLLLCAALCDRGDSRRFRGHPRRAALHRQVQARCRPWYSLHASDGVQLHRRGAHLPSGHYNSLRWPGHQHLGR